MEVGAICPPPASEDPKISQDIKDSPFVAKINVRNTLHWWSCDSYEIFGEIIWIPENSAVKLPINTAFKNIVFFVAHITKSKIYLNQATLELIFKGSAFRFKRFHTFRKSNSLVRPSVGKNWGSQATATAIGFVSTLTLTVTVGLIQLRKPILHHQAAHWKWSNRICLPSTFSRTSLPTQVMLFGVHHEVVLQTCRSWDTPRSVRSSSGNTETMLSVASASTKTITSTR